LAREPSLSGAQPELLSDQVHDVGPVRLVEDGEVGAQPQWRARELQEPVRDRVERAAPHAPGLADSRHALGPREHLAGGPPGERQQQDPLRRDPAFEQGRDPRRERGGLARPGPGHDEQGAVSEHGGRPLRAVQRVFEHLFESIGPMAGPRARPRTALPERPGSWTMRAMSDEPRIRVLTNGPYVVRGGVPIARTAQVETEYGEPIDWEPLDPLEPEDPARYQLCRCGQSETKP